MYQVEMTETSYFSTPPPLDLDPRFFEVSEVRVTSFEVDEQHPEWEKGYRGSTNPIRIIGTGGKGRILWKVKKPSIKAVREAGLFKEYAIAKRQLPKTVVFNPK